MYKVIKKFRDLQDGNHLYEVGETYPREGKKASQKRLAELSGTGNRSGMALIEEIPEEKPEGKPEEKPEEPKEEVPAKKKKSQKKGK